MTATKTVRATYGRYLSSHTDPGVQGVDYYVLEYVGWGARNPEYDTVYFHHPEGDEVVTVDESGRVVEVSPSYAVM
jgi:hypothetical protein